MTSTKDESELLDRLAQALGQSTRGPEIDGGARRRFLDDARAAMNLVHGEGGRDGLTGSQLSALEALILVDGTRPMLKVDDDGIDLASVDPATGWRDALALEGRLDETLRAVGRVFSPLDGQHTGTAWVVAPGLVATNAHVLLEIARPSRLAPGTWSFDRPFLVDFGAETCASPDVAFRITAVESSTHEVMPADFDPEDVDLALLQVESRSRSGSRLPSPLRTSALDSRGGLAHPVYVIGYPTRPARAGQTLSVPAPGTEHQAVLDALLADVYGTKRLCPGQVMGPPPSLRDGANSFAHDASTLGGFSGAPVVAFKSSGTAVGIHVAGNPRRRNYANRLRAVGSSPDP